jgi:hypothetical protein
MAQKHRSFSERIDELEALLDDASVRSNRGVYNNICQQIADLAKQRDAFRGTLVFERNGTTVEMPMWSTR